MPNLCSTLITIYERNDEKDAVALAPLMQDANTYMIKYLDDGIVESVNLKQLWKSGNLYVKGRVDLESYLL